MTSISQDKLLSMLADELDAARLQLEDLGVKLCSNFEIARHHMNELQALDYVGQRCASVGAILRSDDMHAASHAATLESITGRLESLIEGLTERRAH
ncbi:hypothetical protein SAMN05444678_102317 [Sphingomonas sp. YR710]|jgi:hypothetical protein|uniref:hypothetical protein n=1 Tax=Sphingomonas sp. YR710 TaxID=1882773 RepID=UPI0008834584|nr:hypothetical protein [Sphingomonas sp. YR710]SDC32763.1 hypothetical protein SAMN05444678_102317 [Sphingomonas sp. YR710]